MSKHYVTIFRSRLRPGVEEEYHELATRMNALAADAGVHLHRVVP